MTTNIQNTPNRELKNQNSIKIGKEIIKSRVMAAPMAGITDLVLRQIIRKYSKTALLTTEMISSEALVQREDCNIVATFEEDRPVAYQISGHKPPLILKSAKILENKASIIDINMGCPVNKVMKATDGCALMKTPEVAQEIIRTLKETINVPITCKFRLGINQENINFIDFAKKMQEAGASAVCVHGRTRVQMYGGSANWKIISALRGEIDIPYYVNGDIVSVETAEKALEESKADGLAIGRGVLGNPWLISDVEEYLENGKQPQERSLEEKLEVLQEHLDKEIAFRGELNGIKFFRKFYPYYIRGIKGASEYRGKLVTEENYTKIIQILDEIKNVG